MLSFVTFQGMVNKITAGKSKWRAWTCRRAAKLGPKEEEEKNELQQVMILACELNKADTLNPLLSSPLSNKPPPSDKSPLFGEESW